MVQDKPIAPVPVPLAHLALVVVALLPLVIQIPVSFNIVLTASLCVYVGCWRSVKPLPPIDAMTKKVVSAIVSASAPVGAD